MMAKGSNDRVKAYPIARLMPADTLLARATRDMCEMETTQVTTFQQPDTDFEFPPPELFWKKDSFSR